MNTFAGMQDLKTSIDAFFRGRFFACQSTGKGHRSGLDALLITASLPENAKGRLADFGAGSGVAALAALCTNPDLNATLIECNEQMFDLASQTLALKENSELAKRATLFKVDILASITDWEKLGLMAESHDYVIANPPYNHAHQRRSPDTLKAEAHVLGADGLLPWIKKAAFLLKPKASLIMIWRSEKLDEILECTKSRFGNVRILPVHSKPGEAAKRILIRAKKGSNAPVSLLPGITLHDEKGRTNPLCEQLMAGEARIDFG